MNNRLDKLNCSDSSESLMDSLVKQLQSFQAVNLGDDDGISSSPPLVPINVAARSWLPRLEQWIQKLGHVCLRFVETCQWY